MSFVKKTWKNRGESGYEDSKFNADNMNDLEERIYQGLSSIIEETDKCIKFSSGVMIQYGSFECEATFQPWGNIYQFEFPSQKFSESFQNVPIVFASTNNPNNTYNYCCYYGNFGTSKIETGILRFSRPVATSGKIKINYLAIGKWK